MMNRGDALLLVIDIQDVLFPQGEGVAQRLIEQTVKLIRGARMLSIPILVTEQNPSKLGATNQAVADAFMDAPRVAKLEFGCFANGAFRDAIAETGRRQILVTGMETHICVMQTVLAGMDSGYEMFVARDAVAAGRGSEHEAGLARMAQAGAVMVTAQMAMFEWLGAAGTPEFRQMLPLLK